MARAAAPSSTLELIAKLFRGLGDASRLEILTLLRDGPRNVSEVIEATGLSQSNASTHLSCLYCCGLVSKQKRGRYVYYRVRNRKVAALLERADALLDDISAHIDACERYGAHPQAGAARPKRRRA